MRTLLILGLILALADNAHAAPTTLTPDRDTQLASKDIGGQRWAIARDRATGKITGNVFDPSGGEPQFVYCTQKDVAAGAFILECYGTGPCDGGDCSAGWDFISEVALPLDFFDGGSPQPTPGPTPKPTPRPTAAPTSSPKPARCSRNGPLTDLTIDCSSLIYYYQYGLTLAGVTSTGSLSIVCMANSAGTLCARGAPITETIAKLTEANANGGAYESITPPSSMELDDNGRTLNVILVVEGERFDFLGFSYQETDPISSAASMFAPPRPENAVEDALQAHDAAKIEAAIRQLQEQFGR